MQTFLPVPSFQISAKLLDYKRLGKQRIEARQILDCLRRGGRNGWRNHPAVLMWKGYEPALAVYSNVMIQEWIDRGYKNTMKLLCYIPDHEMPPWLGNPRFHAAHRSNLLRKMPEYYVQFGWSEPDNLPYVWPTKEGLM